jgi:HPt (histidine-containing phosphotransfer) domain-containing protein
MDDALLFFQRYKLPFAGLSVRAGKRQIRTSFGRRPRGLVWHDAGIGIGSPAVMTSPPPSLAAFLQAQRAEYRSALPQRLEQIESLWRQVLNGEAPALEGLERCAHSLAGSGATFGLAALGDAARVLEMAVSPLAGAAKALTPAEQTGVGRAVQAFCRSLSAEIGIQGD